ERREQMPWQGGIIDRQIPVLAIFTHNSFRQASPSVSRERNPIAAIAKGIENLLFGIRLRNARHHVMADINPSPPRIRDRNIAQTGKFPVKTFFKKIQMAAVLRIGTSQCAAAPYLHSAVRQQAIVKP